MSSTFLFAALNAVLLMTMPEMGAKEQPELAARKGKDATVAEVGQTMPETVLAGKWLSSFEEGQTLASQFDVPLVLHFEATWCGPCRQMAGSVLNQPEVSRQLATAVVGVRIDADRHAALISKYRVSSLPTEVILASDGTELARYVGGSSLSSYIARLQNHARPVSDKSPDQTIAAGEEKAKSQSEKSVEPGKAAGTGSIARSNNLLADQNSADQDSDDSKRRSCLIVQRDGKTVGLGGFSPVALIVEKVWQSGSDQFVASFEGVDYFFRSAEERDMFQKTPRVYIPQLHGFDPVELFSEQRAEVGSIEYGAFYRGQLFFFANYENRRLFQNNPSLYASRSLTADLETSAGVPFLRNGIIE
ncbi:MAG: thioredoxin domain-containing protein [Planctomyces sp.]